MRDKDDQGCKAVALPIDGTPIILVSSNGHAAGVLAAMGYNVYSLRFRRGGPHTPAHP